MDGMDWVPVLQGFAAGGAILGTVIKVRVYLRGRYVYRLAHSNVFHTRACPCMRRKRFVRMTESNAVASGLTPCRHCLGSGEG